jgi:hypothetical protein
VKRLTKRDLDVINRNMAELQQIQHDLDRFKQLDLPDQAKQTCDELCARCQTDRQRYEQLKSMFFSESI